MKTRKTFLTAGAITAFSLSLGFGQTSPDRVTGATENYTEERTTITEIPAEQEQENLSPQDRMQQQDQALQQQQEQQQFGAPESRETQTQVRSQTSSQSQMQAQKMSELKGSEVQSAAGERIGTVDDIAVNLQTGEASYLIVSAGGFLGIGGELRPVPLQAVEFKEQDGKTQAMVNITDQQWENAPTVTREEIASLGEEQQGREIYEFYGEEYQQSQQRQFGAPDRSGETPDESIDQLLQQHRERQQQEQQQQQQQSSSGSAQQSEASQSGQQEFGSPNRDASSSSPGSSAEQSTSGQSSSIQQSSSNQPSTSSGASATQSSGQSEQQEFGAQPQQRQSSATQTQQAQQSQSQGQIHLASDLLEKQVTNSQQQKLGQISDLLIDTQHGRIAFVLLEPDSAFWQSSDETFAVSPQSFQSISDQDAVLNITQQDLERAQMLNDSNIQQHAQQAQSSSGQNQVFRYQESGDSGSRGVFGSPDRSRESTNN